MDSLMRSKGTLTVSMGEGYLSLYEACGLRRGQVVRSRHLAGSAHAILYNGTPLAQAEVVILGREGGDDIWAVRVCDTDFPSTFAFGPSRKDDVGELVPFTLTLGSIRVSLSELAGVGRNSIISLGKPWSAEVDADLVVAGLPMARGKVVVIEEEMGLRITETLGDPCETPIVGSSGYLLDGERDGGRRIKDYDFRRPDKFPKTLLDRLTGIHDLFLRNLRARLPALAATLAETPVVDQCTLGEATALLAEQGVRERLVVVNRAWRRSGVAGAWGTLPVRVLVEEEGTAYPLGPGFQAMAETYLHQYSLADRGALFVMHRSESPIEGGREAFLACLRDGWRNVVDLNLEPLPPSESAGAGLSENEMVILVTLAAKDGETAFGLVYPYLMLEPYVRVLGG